MIGLGLGLPSIATTSGDAVVEGTFLIDDDGLFLQTDIEEFFLTLQEDAPDPE
jgi:hypothetical protein